jgi:predicted transcriptional regulator
LVYKVLEINDVEREIYNFCNNERTVQELTNLCGKSRSLVQRYLKNMMAKGLLVREGRREKAFYYVYKSVPMEFLEKVVKATLKEWYKKAMEMFD